MAEWYRLEKGGKRYNTQSRFLKKICVMFKGYSDKNTKGGFYYANEHLLPFKLTKEERDKYKVLLRLTK